LRREEKRSAREKESGKKMERLEQRNKSENIRIRKKKKMSRGPQENVSLILAGSEMSKLLEPSGTILHHTAQQLDPLGQINDLIYPYHLGSEFHRTPASFKISQAADQSVSFHHPP
jgi:hypothetical protein